MVRDDKSQPFIKSYDLAMGIISPCDVLKTYFQRSISVDACVKRRNPVIQ